MVDIEDTPLLHDNIVGQVIDLLYDDGSKWSVKVTEFDPILNLHTIDSTRLDVEPKESPNWFFTEGVSLNSLLERDELKIVPYPNIISLPSLAVCGCDKHPLDDNVLHHQFCLAKLHSQNQVKITVLRYNEVTHTHVCQVQLRGKSCQYAIDLNAELFAGTLSSSHSQHILNHLRSAFGVDSMPERVREAHT